MTAPASTFAAQFRGLTGFEPFAWQTRLFEQFARGGLPAALDLPTGLGKTSVMAVWLIALAQGADLPRRLVYVVDRRAVVDQASAEAEKLRGNAEQILGIRHLPISTLRGRFVDNREWLADPAAPAIIVGTVDLVGSRLLFSGYGVSPKMRPYHAGLLGADALIVLDEAHLVPPFAHLLAAIEQDALLWPKDEADRRLLPRFKVLPLSATQGDLSADAGGRRRFRLEEADWKTDCVVRDRLAARKRLRLEPLAQKDPNRQLAEAAWAIATEGSRAFRVLIFCNRRGKESTDEGGGPSAQGVADAIADLAKGNKKTGRAKREVHPVELLVGARRLHERDGVAERLRDLGFIGEKKPIEKPAFLVATSAGEVGIDISADHMVSDIAAWERMVQRLGRVNRRGEGEAEVTVFWCAPTIKNAAAPTPLEQRALTAFASRAVIEKLPQIDGAADASPGALSALAETARRDGTLATLIGAATTVEPLRPALSRALVDAWSMTSLGHHTGRPEVAPWLRGWVEDVPQTTVVWRSHLPLRDPSRDWPRTSAERKEVEEFFEAALPHQSEKLEIETFRVTAWLQHRGRALLAGRGSGPEEQAEEETDDSEEPEAEKVDSEDRENPHVPAKLAPLKRDDTVALLLSSDGACAGGYTLGELAQERKRSAKDDFENSLTGKILILDARLAGLKDGLLQAACDDPPETADFGTGWSKQVGFRVRREATRREPEDDWRFENEFVICRDGEGNPLECLTVEHFREAVGKEDARSIARPQELAEHQDWTRRAAKRIAARVGLSGPMAEALAVAAALHDEGKKAQRWQRAFKAPRDARLCGLREPLAKTRGPIDQALLDGYRHEFGSLRYVEKSAEFAALPDDLRDLVLHLVAAHHGFARPLIETRGCEDAPPSALERRARDVALRFARLQRRWGPWGLAWLEALLRAADAQASRDNDEKRRPPQPEGG